MAELMFHGRYGVTTVGRWIAAMHPSADYRQQVISEPAPQLEVIQFCSASATGARPRFWKFPLLVLGGFLDFEWRRYSV
jgi:hypothetical protein